MKSARVFLLLSLVLLLFAVGCAGTMEPLPPGTASTADHGGGGTGSTGGNGGGGTGTTGGGSGGGSSPNEFVYVTENPNAASIVEGFSIAHDGSLSRIGSVNAGSNATEIVATSRSVIVGNSPFGLFPRPAIQLFSFSIGDSGALSPADTFTFTNGADTLAGLVLDSTGHNLYAGSQSAASSGTISSFDFDDHSGHLSSLGPDVSPSFMPSRLTINPNGRFLYMQNAPRHHTADRLALELLQRDPGSGILTATHRTFTGRDPCCEGFSDFAYGLDGKYLLAVHTDFTPNVSIFSIDPATGDLTLVSELRGNFTSIAVDKTGRFAILPHGTGSIESYRINSDGTLTLASTDNDPPGLLNVVIDPANKFVYAFNTSSPQIWAFTFDQNSGALGNVPGSPFAASSMPIRMVTAGK